MRRLLALGVTIFAPRHRVGTAVIVINEADEVLLLYHVFHPQVPWGTPGGWVDRGEDPALAAERELWEETGIRASAGPLIYMKREPVPDHIGMAYLVELNSSDLPAKLTLSDEIIDAQWFHIDQLPDVLLPFTRTAIRKAFQLRLNRTVAGTRH